MWFTYVFAIVNFQYFWREITSLTWRPKFCFSIMRYLMTVSEMTLHKDFKTENLLKYAHPVKRCNRRLKNLNFLHFDVFEV